MRTDGISTVAKLRLNEASLPQELAFSLSHGQTLIVLEALGFSEGITAETFNHYIKSLRKMSVPFDKQIHPDGRRHTARYNFYHLMELTLALTLRVYWTLPDVIVQGIREHRAVLCRIYRAAYAEADSGRGAPLRVVLGSQGNMTLRGIFLDPGIHYGGGQLLSMDKPVLLTPAEALRAFGAGSPGSKTHLPLNLSALALRLVDAVNGLEKGRARGRPGKSPLSPQATKARPARGT